MLGGYAWRCEASDRVRGKRRTDIEKNGTAFSMLYVGVAGLAVWGVLCAMLTGGYAGAALWGKSSRRARGPSPAAWRPLAGIETLPDVAGLLAGA
jgi:energy-converting hydrogenase Eha subunit G